MVKNYLVTLNTGKFVVSFYNEIVIIEAVDGKDLGLTMEGILALLSPFKADIKNAMSHIPAFDIIRDVNNCEMNFRLVRHVTTARGVFSINKDIYATILTMDAENEQWVCNQCRIYIGMPELMAIAQENFSIDPLFGMHNLCWEELNMLSPDDESLISSNMAEYVKSLL